MLYTHSINQLHLRSIRKYEKISNDSNRNCITVKRIKIIFCKVQAITYKKPFFAIFEGKQILIFLLACLFEMFIFDRSHHNVNRCDKYINCEFPHHNQRKMLKIKLFLKSKFIEKKQIFQPTYSFLQCKRIMNRWVTFISMSGISLIEMYQSFIFIVVSIHCIPSSRNIAMV